jgi:hypothetical protein
MQTEPIPDALRLLVVDLNAALELKPARTH